MRTLKFIALSSAIAWGSIAPLAFAESIAFNDTTPDGKYVSGEATAYGESGYQLTNLSSGLYAFLPPSGAATSFGPASSSAFLAFANVISPTLSRSDGQLFNLISLDVGIGSFAVTEAVLHLVGERADATTFTYDFAIHDSQWHTLLFAENSNFVGLRSVTFSSNFIATGLDNISVSQVPVPAAVWLFGSGLIGLAGSARRKTRNAQSSCIEK